jgi:hypothetical protein
MRSTAQARTGQARAFEFPIRLQTTRRPKVKSCIAPLDLCRHDDPGFDQRYPLIRGRKKQEGAWGRHVLEAPRSLNLRPSLSLVVRRHRHAPQEFGTFKKPLHKSTQGLDTKMIALRWTFKIIARKPAPDRVPRSGEAAEKQDCYLAIVRGMPVGTHMAVDSSNATGVSGRLFGQPVPLEPQALSWEALEKLSLEITHFLGPYDFKFSSPRKFLWAHFTKWPQLYRVGQRLRQLLFNRKKLVRVDRIKALRHLVEQRIGRRDARSSPVQLLAELHSFRAFHHPTKEEQIAYCTLLMDSLVASGDLSFEQGSYRVAPKALVTLAQHDEDNRRHRDNTIIQWLVVWLTTILAIAAGIEAWDIASKWNMTWWPW